MQVLISAVIVLGLLQGPEFTRGEDFGYDGNIGPSYWGERYRECTGKHQSPININVLRVKQVTLPDIVFIGFDDSIDDVHVTNNGHTDIALVLYQPDCPLLNTASLNMEGFSIIPMLGMPLEDPSIRYQFLRKRCYLPSVLIEVQNEPHPRVRGGPLDGDYVFSQMHFHWGDNDTFGSEDKINHRSFPMELHMVFFKEEYKNVPEAVKHHDGLTVLAFFYELDRHQHPAYDEITSALGNVTEPHTTVVMSHPFSFLNILPYDLKRYFTYKGSLTTPPCSEVVIWLDFEQPVRLTHEQIEAFRELRSANGKITHNFRPIQPLGDRVVFYNIDNSYYTYNEIDDPDDNKDKDTPGKKKRGRNNGSLLQSGVHCILFSSLILALYS